MSFSEGIKISPSHQTDLTPSPKKILLCCIRPRPKLVSLSNYVGILSSMPAIPQNEQHALVQRLTAACGGAYSPAERRKYFITGPQWAAAYEGNALFHAPTRPPIGFEEVIRRYAEIGIGY